MSFWFNISEERYERLCLHRLIDKRQMDMDRLFVYIRQHSYPHDSLEIISLFKRAILKLIKEDSIWVYEFDFGIMDNIRIDFNANEEKLNEIIYIEKRRNTYMVLPSEKTLIRQLEITNGQLSKSGIEIMLEAERMAKKNHHNIFGIPFH